ncbi:conserved hypothetical protein [Trichinella spiralis]|uniref:hypothetical protein n=1 Tax=Trichinella spiralis TaxID=6334 RepID=UPI0001EFB6CA|nr:conserved hypothetical protein [Trichinella spiralis]
MEFWRLANMGHGLRQLYRSLRALEASEFAMIISAHNASASGIFQRFMDSWLANLDDVVPGFDDVLIVSDSQHELLEVLRRVFDRLHDAGIHLNREKCVFVSHSVKFHGYRMDAEGIHPSEEKVEAIYKAPLIWTIPESIYYSRDVLLHKANKSHPSEALHRLLDKGMLCKWTQRQEKALLLLTPYTRVSVTCDLLLSNKYCVSRCWCLVDC